jgi:putative N-acetylmannosamine-6-phosphate epimerase
LLQPEEARIILTLAMETAMRYLPQNHKVLKRLLDTYENLRSYLNPKEIPQPNRNSTPSRPSIVNTLAKPFGSQSPRAAKLLQLVNGPSEGGDFSVLADPLKSSNHPCRPRSSMIHYTGMQDGIFEHALGRKYRPYYSEIRAEAKHFVTRRRAAHRIQRLWKLFKKKRSQEAYIVQMQDAARSYHNHRQIKLETEGAKRIQSAWRGRKRQNVRRRRMIAVRKIQRAWRKKLYDHKTVIIQRNVRIFLKRLALLRISATRIQSQVRGIIARRSYMMKQKRDVVRNQIEEWINPAQQQVLQKKLICEHIVPAWTKNELNATVPQRIISLHTSAILEHQEVEVPCSTGTAQQPPVIEVLSSSEVVEYDVKDCEQVTEDVKDCEQVTEDVKDCKQITELPVIGSIMINLTVSSWIIAAVQNVMKHRGYSPILAHHEVEVPCSTGTVQQPPVIEVLSAQQPPVIEVLSAQQPPVIEVLSAQQPPVIEVLSSSEVVEYDVKDCEQVTEDVKDCEQVTEDVKDCKQVTEHPVIGSIMINLTVSSWIIAAVQNVMKHGGYNPIQLLPSIPRGNLSSDGPPILPVQVSIWIQQLVSYWMVVGIQSALDTLLSENQEGSLAPEVLK